jgi:DNA-binding LytR/AlgR family response regulator
MAKIRIKKGRKLISVDISDVYYVSVDIDLCTLYLINDDFYCLTRSLKSFIAEYATDFIRISRNTLVNRHKIKEMDLSTKKIKLINDKLLDYSRRNGKSIKDALKQG